MSSSVGFSHSFDLYDLNGTFKSAGGTCENRRVGARRPQLFFFIFFNFVFIVMIGSAFFSENRMKGECRWWRVWSTQGDFNARSGK